MSKSVKFIVSTTLTIILYGWSFYNSSQAPSLQASFIPSYSHVQEKQDTTPYFHEEFLYAPKRGKIAHASSITELKDQSLHAVWYAGSREGAKDVAIFYTSKEKGEVEWGNPRVLVDRVSAAKELRRYIRKVGNPIIFTDQEDRLWLIYVTIPIGGWSVCSLNVKFSEDGGDTWTRSKRLTLSPFLNISELVRSNPISLSNGGLVLPIAHECIGLFSELLTIHKKKDGTLFYSKKRLTDRRNYEQPCMIAFNDQSAAVFHRSYKSENIGLSKTNNRGVCWSEVTRTSLPNPNAGISALMLSDQRILIVFNNSNSKRDNLTLAISHDGGQQWKSFLALEEMSDWRFSYPYLFQSSDSLIHLLYTWEQVGIKYVTFNKRWLDEQVLFLKEKSAGNKSISH